MRHNDAQHYHVIPSTILPGGRPGETVLELPRGEGGSERGHPELQSCDFSQGVRTSRTPCEISHADPACEISCAPFLLSFFATREVCSVGEKPTQGHSGRKRHQWVRNPPIYIYIYIYICPWGPPPPGTCDRGPAQTVCIYIYGWIPWPPCEVSCPRSRTRAQSRTPREIIPACEKSQG